MALAKAETSTGNPEFDGKIAKLVAAKDKWARTSVAQRIGILDAIKDALEVASEEWARVACENKLIDPGSSLAGEEWLSGPYALMSTCNNLIRTLGDLNGKRYLDALRKRETPSGQLAVRVAPASLWDQLLLSGVKAEVWMEKGVTAATLREYSAGAYDDNLAERQGRVALVLGAGNISAIAPLDCFQKLFLEHQVVILKLNPVNEYLFDVLSRSLAPLIRMDALQIVKGGGAEGAYLTTHPDIEEIHITGAVATHDAIVWGPGDQGRANKKAGKRLNKRRITSELGAVCPTIVVPGPWSRADVAFQAQNVATQKMHNSGFNCIACQVMIMPRQWEKADAFQKSVTAELGRAQRQPYYPGAVSRMEEFRAKSGNPTLIDRGKTPALVLNHLSDKTDTYFEKNEIFAPALSVYDIDETDPEAFLIRAIKYANERLEGTLGANILIHPDTQKAIGRKRFEEILADLRYGTIAINTWSGLGFLLTQTPWGAFPGHTLEDVESGIGFVHNTNMFDRPERTIVSAPWRPFPRGVLSGQMTLLPKPPWFITNRRQHKTAKLLTSFVYRPGWLKLPRLFANALLG